MRDPRRAALAVLLVSALTGCGANITAAPTGRTSVTIENCGRQVTYDRVPRRVVTNDVGITEIMFALGLEKRMAGFAMPDDVGDPADVPWRSGYDTVPRLSTKEITKELVVNAHADMVFAGWNYGFSDASGLTPDSLRKLGIASYVLTESCHNGRDDARGIMPPLQALYTDLTNLGKLFGVQGRARRLVAKFRAQVSEAQSQARVSGDRGRPSVFLYDSGQDKPFTSGRFAAPQDIISRAGGTNIFAGLDDSWTTVGWESVVERDPDVIVINNYGATSAVQKEKFLLSYPPLANVSAVRHHRFFVLDYADLVESPRNPAAVAALGAYLSAHPRKTGGASRASH